MKMRATFWSLLLSMFAFTNAATHVEQLHIDEKDSRIYVNISGREYYIGYWEDDVTVAQATVFCSNIEMDLIAFEEEEEYAAVTDHLFNHFMYYDYFWTGGHRKSGGEWAWGDTELPFTFQVWGQNQPDVAPSESACLYFSVIDSWIDVTCDQPHRFICEKN